MKRTAGHPAMALERVSYWYPSVGPSRPVVRDISMAVHFGETLRIRGRNGCGKTTLLRVLSGDLHPTAGERRLASPALRVFYLDQSAARLLAESLTIAEHILLASPGDSGVMESPSHASIRQKLRGTMTPFALGLEDRMDEFIGHLSDGQRQVVALATVLSSRPDVLLLDEFTTYLDPTSEAAAVRLVRAATDSAVAVVYVGHTEPSPLPPSRTIDLECPAIKSAS